VAGDPQAGVPFSADDVDVAAYAELREACLRIGFLPSFRHGILLDAAMVAPDDQAAVAAIRGATHQEVRRFGVGSSDFERAVRALEGPLRPGPAAPEGGGSLGTPEAWETATRTAREVAFDLVRFAFGNGASDLLLDDQEDWMEVAVKLAGEKEILPPIDRAFAPGLLRAFKEIAGLSTHTSTVWQSGFASVPVSNRRADLRIEITPTVHGESLVARLQDRQLQLERMRRLPFTDPLQLRIARACLGQRQGLIIATGPTGHGKTTTLYSCLGQLDRSTLNIRTLEDPVEFTIPWITQIPVGSGTGRSFSEGLKSLLRQAPHVILIGEIRDLAVAQTCIEAVDTGHLILATLHTRDAVGAISRLLDLGITARQVSGALSLVIGQRLVKRLCPHCRRPVAPDPLQARHFEAYALPVPAALHVPVGCPECAGRGERGLAPIFEFLHVSGGSELEEEIARAGRDGFNERAFRARWLELGGSPLVREGLRLAAGGQVAHGEVLKYERSPPDCYYTGDDANGR
jgi:type II secretory ATPase GspE/PulE/Tfp pilus assembly ATPase PilB-like protein